MMKFICFSSGSSGNCYYINVGGYGLLIDEGLAVRKFKKYFSDYGLSLAEVKGVLVTHDHADHVKAVGALAMEFKWPVYALEGVFAGMMRNRYMRKKVPGPLVRNVEPGVTVELGPFKVTPFNVPHDSMACCGYTIETEDFNFCLITDAGHVTDDMRHHLGRARYVVVEANYDAAMLEAGPYPRMLKERIRSGRGHMDNALTAELLATELSADARRVWLCHLSEENNRPDVALTTVTTALKAAGRLGEADALVVEALQRTHPSRLYELE